MRWIPNLLTLANLIAGCAGIYALSVDEPRYALMCALFSLVMDFFDGFSARLLGSNSGLGVQLDSLADVVSFGVFPAFIFIHLRAKWCAESESFSFMDLIPLVFAGAAALRLARFNLDTRDPEVFYGLPVPAAAVTVFGILLMDVSDQMWVADFICNRAFFYVLVVALPLLMLTDLRLWSMKGVGQPRGRVIFASFLVLFVILVIVCKSAAFVLIVAAYLLFGLINQLLKLY